MRAPNQPTRGADVRYKYVDGVVTAGELWPWPTESQVQVELSGTGVTYEADGGIWKTLDGVYTAASPTIVSLSTPNGSNLIERGAGTQTVTLSRTQSTTGNLEVNLTIGGSANAGSHYEALADVWTLADGMASTNITVTAIEDSTYTGDLTITFTIDADASYTVAGSMVTLNRIDGDQNSALTTGRDSSGQSRSIGRPL
jgi:hypothetical protein